MQVDEDTSVQHSIYIRTWPAAQREVSCMYISGGFSASDVTLSRQWNSLDDS